MQEAESNYDDFSFLVHNALSGAGAMPLSPVRAERHGFEYFLHGTLSKPKRDAFCMTKKDMPFFATESDWSALVVRANLTVPLQLAVAGLFDEPKIEVVDLLTNPTPLTSYLVAHRGCPISLRVVRQRGGGEKYAVDQMDNPDTIIFRFGGMLGTGRLVASQLGTSGPSARSAELSALIANEIRAQFSKIKSYYVGSEAAELLDLGTRLTPTSKAPKEYDLVR